MIRVASRTFQKAYPKIPVPALVTTWHEPIGLWIPADTDLYAVLTIDMDQELEVDHDAEDQYD